ncbi:hypothetical protein PL373_16740 [Tenacibaculum maritimum]|nr:hypothetical protein [Tenacibaculum maritimum]MDB0602743.1 hypothetical protein [Tenacibaculum maritimum]MDB0612345.1 hypothetical protein [Tenacibaculum maritimum]
MTKQEFIKKEWIAFYGESKYEKIKYAINKFGYIDFKKNPEVSKIINTSAPGIYWGTTDYRPLSLVGVNNNNGWIKKEERFPLDSDLVLWFNVENSEYELATLMQCDFKHDNYTHWSRINEKTPMY